RDGNPPDGRHPGFLMAPHRIDREPNTRAHSAASRASRTILDTIRVNSDLPVARHLTQPETRSFHDFKPTIASDYHSISRQPAQQRPCMCTCTRDDTSASARTECSFRGTIQGAKYWDN